MADKLPPKAARLQQAFAWLQSNGKVDNREAFADSIRKSYSHMSSVFNGNRELTEDVALAIEKKYHISMPWLLLGVGEMEKKSTKQVDTTAMLRAIMKDLSLIKEHLGITTPQ